MFKILFFSSLQFSVLLFIMSVWPSKNLNLKNSQKHFFKSRQTGEVFKRVALVDLWKQGTYNEKGKDFIISKVFLSRILTCCPDSLEAAWDGFLVSNNHKSHYFRPQGMVSGPEWRFPTWWLQMTTKSEHEKDGEAYREIKRERARKGLARIPVDFTHLVTH